MSSDRIEPPTDTRDDAWYYHDERDHAWHTEAYYDECRLCNDEFEKDSANAE